jgi:hypothetical protein
MTPEELIGQWQWGLGNSHRAHYEAATYFERLHLWIGVPTVIVSALLGTTVFTSLQHADAAWVKTLMAVLSVSMIALTSLQTFFKYSERAERHKTAAVQLGEVRRELEQKLQFGPVDEAFARAIRQKWDAADRQAPTFPPGLYDRVNATRKKEALQKLPRSTDQGAASESEGSAGRGVA